MWTNVHQSGDSCRRAERHRLTDELVDRAGVTGWWTEPDPMSKARTDPSPVDKRNDVYPCRRCVQGVRQHPQNSSLRRLMRPVRRLKLRQMILRLQVVDDLPDQCRIAQVFILSLPQWMEYNHFKHRFICQVNITANFLFWDACELLCVKINSACRFAFLQWSPMFPVSRGGCGTLLVAWNVISTWLIGVGLQLENHRKSCRNQLSFVSD